MLLLNIVIRGLLAMHGICLKKAVSTTDKVLNLAFIATNSTWPISLLCKFVVALDTNDMGHILWSRGCDT